MALEPTVVSESLTVENPVQELRLAVSSSPPWYTNKKYTIDVSYRSNIASESSGSEPFNPTITVKYSNGNTQTITASGTLYYGTEGTSASATATWMPSDNYSATITASWEDLVSNEVTGEVYAPTAFTGAYIHPNEVNPGGAVGVYAYLKYFINDKWEPLPNASVALQLLDSSGSVLYTDTANTNDNGLVSFTIYAPTKPGKYVVRLSFNPKAYGGIGNLLPSKVDIALSAVEAVSEASEIAKYVLVVGAVALAGYFIYKLVSRHL